MIIRKIRIVGFKKVQDLNLLVDGVSLLVGSNNSGKSSILQAIQFAASSAKTLKRLGGEERAFRASDDKVIFAKEESITGIVSSLTPDDFLYAPITDVHRLHYSGRFTSGKSLRVEFWLETARTETSSGYSPFVVNVKKGNNKGLTVSTLSLLPHDEVKDFYESDQHVSILVPGLAGLAQSEEYRSTPIVHKSAVRGDANLFLRNILVLLHEKQNEWHNFVTDLNVIFENIELQIKSNASRDEYILIECKNGNNENWFTFDSMGTGFLQVVQILSYIHYFKPKILLLDEPDSHIHPNNQKKLLHLITKRSREFDISTVIATHSRHLIAEADGIAKICWVSNGLLNQEDSETLSILMELGALDQDEFFGQKRFRYFILTEDEDVKGITIAANNAGFGINVDTKIWSY